MSIIKKICKNVHTNIAILAIFGSLSWAQASEFGMPIVNGQEVLPTDPIARTTVALILFAGKDAALCTGSLMDSTHILTAAHCVEGVTSGVAIFKLSVPTTESPKKEEMRTITHIVKSEDYPGNAQINSRQDFHDLAILTFKGGLPAGYEPVKIISSQMYDKAVKKGVTTVVAGYGTTSGDGTGDGTLRKTKLKIQGEHSPGVSVMLRAPGTSACTGDSGGPAYVSIAGQYYLWGVLSRGERGCASYSIYTKFVSGQDVNGASAVAALE